MLVVHCMGMPPYRMIEGTLYMFMYIYVALISDLSIMLKEMTHDIAVKTGCFYPARYANFSRLFVNIITIVCSNDPQSEVTYSP